MTRHCITLLCTTLLLLTVSFHGQSLNSDERKLAVLIDRNAADGLALLEKAVNIDSPTDEPDGVRQVGRLFADELKAIGMEVSWIEMPAEAKRAGHLVAETKGSKGKRLLLLGHLDTVLKGERFRRDGDKAFGTGIGDMKGGDVILIQALKALHQAGFLKDTRLVVMLTGDEENSCEPVSICRGDMIAAAKRSDAALSFEGTVRNTATVGRRGASSWRLEIESKTGHSSQIFRDGMGNGAIFEASRILNEFRIGGRKIFDIQSIAYTWRDNDGIDRFCRIGGGKDECRSCRGRSQRRPAVYKRGTERSGASENARDRCQIASGYDGPDHISRRDPGDDTSPWKLWPAQAARRRQ